jgi:hypothetical protein
LRWKEEVVVVVVVVVKLVGDLVIARGMGDRWCILGHLSGKLSCSESAGCLVIIISL